MSGSDVRGRYPWHHNAKRGVPQRVARHVSVTLRAGRTGGSRTAPEGDMAATRRLASPRGEQRAGEPRSGAPLRTSFRNDDLDFDVLEEGPEDGDTVILLHGFPGGADTWERVAPILNGAGLRTLTLTQRGYGSRCRPDGVDAYSVDRLVGDVMALIRTRTNGGPVHVVGHDWGGIVAWQLAAAHGQLVSSLTVLSTPHPRAFARSLFVSDQAMRSSYAMAWQMPLLPERVLLARHGRVLRDGLHASGLSGPIADRYTAAMQEPGRLRSALNWYRAAGRRPLGLAQAGRVAVPTRYIWSTEDQALGRSAAERTGSYTDGPYQFTVIEGASHWLPEEHATAVAPMIVDHVAAHRPRAAGGSPGAAGARRPGRNRGRNPGRARAASRT
jgi:pimeloyl-ACP methyl ester carboxylesterase